MLILSNTSACMKRTHFIYSVLLLSFCNVFIPATAQRAAAIQQLFSAGTVFHPTIPYAADTLQKHLLDLYLPGKPKAKTPLVVFVHGGA